MIHLTTIPIFRRLFLAFFLAALLLNGMLLGMSLLYIHLLQMHGMTQSETQPFLFYTMVAMIVATAALTTLGYAMNLTITQPLTNLAAFARRIRAGQTHARAPVLGKDEIAVVAESINHMLSALEQSVQHTQAQHDRLQDAAEKLVEQVTSIGDGDLTVQAEVNFESIGVLADVFNYIVEELSSLVVRVKYMVMGVERSTLVTQREMFLLVNGADTQLSSIGQTATTVENMAKACLQVVDRTKQLNLAAREARQAAHQGRDTVQQILQGVAHINRKTQETALSIQVLEGRSQEIDEVIRLLESFVQQTTRLALDAAVQVSVIGDVGTNRGFGAIAAEIRRISEQAKERLTSVSTNMRRMRTDMETVALAIADTARESVSGTAHIQETGQFFSTIFSLVEQQAGESDTIAVMMEQLYESSFHIAATMQAISRQTQQGSERTRKVAQEMQILASHAQQLRGSVEVFKLKASFQEEAKEALKTR